MFRSLLLLVQVPPGLPVLGHSQPSLAGLFLTLISTQDWRPGLLSAVPVRQAQGRLCGTDRDLPW